MELPGPVSKSQIASFLTCPWLWYAFKILKIKQEIGLPAMIGIWTHDLIQEIIVDGLSWSEAFAKAQRKEVGDLLTLANTWWPLGDLREKYLAGNLIVEEQLYATRKGKGVKTPRSAIVTGVVDLAEDAGRIVYIDDWKTGAWEKDNDLERNIYAGILAPAKFPKAQEVVFTLRFIQTGHTLQSTYQFSKSGHTCIVTDPNGDVIVRAAQENPFLQDIKEIVAQIEAAKPTPKHGVHCKKQYGSPCQFYADGSCPYWEKKLKE